MLTVEKMKSILIQFAFCLMILGCGYVGLKYIVPFMMPFLIAWAFATVIHWAAQKVQNYLRTREHKKTMAILGSKGVVKIILIIFYVMFAIALVGLISWLVDAFSALPGTVTNFYNNLIAPIFSYIQTAMIAEADATSAEILVNFKNMFIQAMSSAGDLLNTIVPTVSKWATSMITGIPNFIWSSVICLIATAFFAVDYEKIYCVIANLIPAEHREGIVKIGKSALGTIPKFLRGYALVLLITFAEVFVWLLILKVKNALLIAVIIALLDILPILGTGTVVIPWAIFSLLTGNVGRGITLAMMYMTITIVRQYIEPKIIGHEIGVYPIITLLSMFIGQKLFGLGGLLGLPIIAAVTINEINTIAKRKGEENGFKTTCSVTETDNA